MQKARLLLALVAALAVGACMHRQPTYYALDPHTGQPVAMVAQPQYAQPRFAQQTYAPPTYRRPSPMQSDHGLYSSSPAYAQQSYDQPAYAPQAYAQPRYTQQAYAQPSYRPTASDERGLFTSGGPFAAQPRYAAPQGGPYVAAAPWRPRSGDPGQ
jgi:hypothetical protein